MATINGHKPSSPFSDTSLFQLPDLPFTNNHESLTAGTSIPAPAPSPPPPKPVPPRRTLTPNPLQQHPPWGDSSLTLTLSTASLSRSGGIPGAFPSSGTPSPATTSPAPMVPRKDYVGNRSQTSTPTLSRTSTPVKPYLTPQYSPPNSNSNNNGYTPNPESKKRPYSVRKLLSLRSLRSNNTSTSPQSFDTSSNYTNGNGSRPASPGGSSVASSMGQTLKKRRSGFFGGRRKSSLMAWDNGGVENGNSGSVNADVEREAERARLAVAEMERNRSPPPRLPELQALGNGFGGGKGLWGEGTDMFAGIQ